MSIMGPTGRSVDRCLLGPRHAPIAVENQREREVPETATWRAKAAPDFKAYYKSLADANVAYKMNGSKVMVWSGELSTLNWNDV